MWDASKVLWSLLIGLFRSRASLEAEILILRGRDCDAAPAFSWRARVREQGAAAPWLAIR